MPKIGRIVERYIHSSNSSSKGSKAKADDTFEASASLREEDAKPVDYSTLELPALFNGKPTLLETAERIGFFNTPLPLGLTLQGGQTVRSVNEAQQHLLQMQRSFLA